MNADKPPENPVAALLRRAAEGMREKAGKATPGPWQHMCLGSEGCLVLRASGTPRERGHGRVARFGHKEWQADHADAAFVTTMRPLFAEAVAGWLEDTAGRAATFMSYGDSECAHEDPCRCERFTGWWCEQCGDPLCDDEGRPVPGGCTCWTAALAVAKAWLGEAGEGS